MGGLEEREKGGIESRCCQIPGTQLSILIPVISRSFHFTPVVSRSLLLSYPLLLYTLPAFTHLPPSILFSVSLLRLAFLLVFLCIFRPLILFFVPFLLLILFFVPPEGDAVQGDEAFFPLQELQAADDDPRRPPPDPPMPPVWGRGVRKVRSSRILCTSRRVVYTCGYVWCINYTSHLVPLSYMLKTMACMLNLYIVFRIS